MEETLREGLNYIPIALMFWGGDVVFKSLSGPGRLAH
jgi:hypothetical protein